jgi:CRP-like cAMP-binding protein
VSAVQDGIANLLLRSLPPATFERMQGELEQRQSTRGEILQRANEPLEFVSFINGGLVSLVKDMSDGRGVEVGAIGIEGVASPCALFGLNQAVVDAVVEIPGPILRMKLDVLRREIEGDEAVRALVGKYARFALFQLVQRAACNRLHHLNQRCCRWLLTAQDSTGSDTFPLTQEYLAMVLGVQRGGVTEAAQGLQEKGLITYRRGIITIRERKKLEAMACECYANLRAARAQIFHDYRAFQQIVSM